MLYYILRAEVRKSLGSFVCFTIYNTLPPPVEKLNVLSCLSVLIINRIVCNFILKKHATRNFYLFLCSIFLIQYFNIWLEKNLVDNDTH